MRIINHILVQAVSLHVFVRLICFCQSGTFQGSVVDALFQFALLNDDGAAGGEQQLPGPRFVALSVILGDWHCVLWLNQIHISIWLKQNS